MWNKKYPICIELAKQDDFMSKAEGDRPDVSKDPTVTTSVPGDRGAGTGGAPGKGKSSFSSRDLTLYLFGRTGREKEEWFQRILVAAKGKGSMKRATSFVGSKHGKKIEFDVVYIQLFGFFCMTMMSGDEYISNFVVNSYG